MFVVGAFLGFVSGRAVVWQSRVGAESEATATSGADARISGGAVATNAARNRVAVGAGAAAFGHAHTLRLAMLPNSPPTRRSA